MRDIHPLLSAELASGVTMLCRCWRVIRRDGLTLGFTDHDRDITFGGLTYLAQSGLDATEAVSTLGFAIGGSDISGALTADALRDDDILAGRWDAASVEVWLVHWPEPEIRTLIEQGQIGDITRIGEKFTAEMRSLAHHFEQEKGRRYESQCSAELGDGHCGVILDHPLMTVAATVFSVTDPTTIAVMTPAGFAAGSFAQGYLTLPDGLGGAERLPVMSHTRSGQIDLISLWSPPVSLLLPGSTVSLTVGCDKRYQTCRDRFSNALNFRGFPHIPGNDYLLGYARQGESGLDGGLVVS
jgi:uncharacterized phage protein (TIGR02218 family)